MHNRHVYRIEGVDCAVCAVRIQDALNRIDGIGSSQIDLMANRLEIVSDRAMDETLDAQVRFTVQQEEPHASLDLSKHKERTTGKRFGVPMRVLVSVLLLIIAGNLRSPWSFATYLLSYVISGHDVVLRALRNIFRGRLFDEQFLMTLATVGAIAIGEYAEAVAVMAFYQAGEWVQDLAVDRSRASIARLMDIRPAQATILIDGVHKNVPVEQVGVGDILLIRPGEKVPIDAVVRTGESELDTKALTGESVPSAVAPGDRIMSGCINGGGVLTAETVVRYEDSTVATILRLVEESGLRKARTERFITRFARYYTPIVVILASSIATVPPLLGLGSFSDWVYRALVFLVISCPCALVISVPLGFFGGIGGLARMGVLVKGSTYVQSLAEAHMVVFDKTGTLTEGTFSISDVRSVDERFTADEVLSLAASVEAHSTHPIARAIVLHHGPSIMPADHVEEIPGRGIRGVVGDRRIYVGIPKESADESGMHTVVSVYCDDEEIGRIAATDPVRLQADETTASLRKLGIGHLAIISGDHEKPVAAVARKLGITEYHARMLPQDKLAFVEESLKRRKAGKSLLFVGDGINDAPVLALSDVGISLGAIGSDAAIEASDVVIMTDDLSRIPDAIVHSRRTLSIVRQNIMFALGIKVVVMALGAAGIASMWLAVFADTGVALLAVLNSLRALRKVPE
ncbi:MAG: heavy metal translocating P-type ATPase [Sphaerochaetaceae bacterium]